MDLTRTTTVHVGIEAKQHWMDYVVILRNCRLSPKFEIVPIFNRMLKLGNLS